jgi:hypothetical protein
VAASHNNIFFWDTVASHLLWFAYSQNFMPCDYHLWKRFRYVVYQKSPHTDVNLKQIKWPEVLVYRKTIFNSMLIRCQGCLACRWSFSTRALGCNMLFRLLICIV